MAVQENEYASMEKNKLNKKFDWEEEIRLLHVKHCCSCHRKLIPNLSFQFSFACGIQFSLFWTIIILIRMLHIRSALFGRTSLITFKEYWHSQERTGIIYLISSFALAITQRVDMIVFSFLLRLDDLCIAQRRGYNQMELLHELLIRDRFKTTALVSIYDC